MWGMLAGYHLSLQVKTPGRMDLMAHLMKCSHLLDKPWIMSIVAYKRLYATQHHYIVDLIAASADREAPAEDLIMYKHNS